MIPSDAQLVERTVAGDDSAFDALVSRHRSRVYHLALSMVRSRDAALDLAQDAFVQAYVTLATLRSPESFGAWLTSITRNLCLMHIRRPREKSMPGEMLDMLESSRMRPADADLDAALAREALDRLPDATRSAAVLYFVEEMKQTEIAEFLGISLPAVKSRIRQARLRLQKEMVDVVRQAAKKDRPGDEFNRELRNKIELARWYREFADLINNGVPMMAALDSLRSQGFTEPITEATSRLMDAIRSGSMMSDALKDLPALTTSQTVGMVRAGEIGGILDWTTQFLADWLEIENAQRELELAFWCRTIGSVVAAGAPAKMALECSFDFVRNPELRQASQDIVKALDAHKPLDPVLAKHSDVLLPMVRVAILAGEKANVMGYALQWAANEVHSRMSGRMFGREFHLPAPKSPWVEAFADAASEHLDSDSSPIRAAAVTILGRLGASRHAEQIERSLADEDADVRRSAVSALADMGDRRSVPKLVGLLTDPETSVRRAAIDALVALNAHEAAADLAGAISDSDQRVANTAIRALETMDEIGVLTSEAIKTLGSERRGSRVRAAHILLDHPTPEAADVLVAALDDEIQNVSCTSALVLAKVGRREAIPVLLKMLEMPDPCFFQREAAKALVEIGDPTAAPHIRRAIEEGRLDPSFAWTAEKLESSLVHLPLVDT